jgi:hypothetical protein
LAGFKQGKSPVINFMKSFLKIAQWCFLAVCLNLAACSFNPFFPPTGEPQTGSIGRSTPAGTVAQVFRAYETRQINLYRDLFSPEKDFRFYVSPSFQEDYARSRGSSNIETIDQAFQYVRGLGITQAYYWTLDEEVQIHNNLFTQAVEITFSVYPQPIDTNTISYVRGPDGKEYAEVVSRGGTMNISVKTEFDRILYVYVVDIGEQVFYLERDPLDPSLWVIAKWFDLGTAQ